MQEMKIEETTQNATMEEWVSHVEEAVNVLVQVPNKEVACRHRP